MPIAALFRARLARRSQERSEGAGGSAHSRADSSGETLISENSGPWLFCGPDLARKQAGPEAVLTPET